MTLLKSADHLDSGYTMRQPVGNFLQAVSYGIRVSFHRLEVFLADPT